jgi:IS4 transposase
MWAVLGKERISSIAEKCNAGDERKRKLPTDLFVKSTLLTVAEKQGYGLYPRQAATACMLSQSSDNPVDALTRSAVGKQMLKRDWSLFMELFKGILKPYWHQLTPLDRHYLKRFKDARIVDSTVVGLNKLLLREFRANDEGEAALKLHTVFDTKFVPVGVHVTEQRYADVNFDFLTGEKNVFYMFDLGYWCFDLFKQIMGQESFFLSRLRSDCDPKICEFISPSYTALKGRRIKLSELKDCNLLGGDTFDAMVKLPGIIGQLRLVGLKHNGGWYFYVTNLMDEEFTPQVIYEIYRLRWQIELFFKWLKHILSLEHISGQRVNSIMSQIYAAMIVYLITRLMIEEAARAYGIPVEKFSMEKCLNLVTLNLDVVVRLIRGEPPPDYLLRLMASSLGIKEKSRRKTAECSDFGQKVRCFVRSVGAISESCLRRLRPILAFGQNLANLS